MTGAMCNVANATITADASNVRAGFATPMVSPPKWQSNQALAMSMAAMDELPLPLADVGDFGLRRR
jgi:hypothetical protein